MHSYDSFELKDHRTPLQGVKFAAMQKQKQQSKQVYLGLKSNLTFEVCQVFSEVCLYQHHLYLWSRFVSLLMFYIVIFPQHNHCVSVGISQNTF